MERRNDLSDQDIVALCADPVSSMRCGQSVIRVSADLAVKYGSHLTETEADNQRQAYALLDQNIVRVPRVERFFRHEDVGYLVMEYIEGEVLQALDGVHYNKIAEILSHFQTIRRSTPGNLCGKGDLYWCPFPEEGVVLDGADQIETWLNRRRLSKGKPIQLTNLVFTHRDLAPRNIIWKDGKPTLIDWFTAGFFPASFEVCSQRAGKDVDFNKRIEQIISSISCVDQLEVETLLLISFNCLRYSLYVLSTLPSTLTNNILAGHNPRISQLGQRATVSPYRKK